MRRILVSVVALASLVGGACSSGDGDDASKAVCATRDKTQMATNGQPVALDQYPEIVDGLQQAAKVAPAGIKSDFLRVHKVLKPFVEALIKANGDSEAAAQDPEFQKLMGAVSTKAANASAARIRKYYEKHC
ncbi:MAG: hypothetical protein QOF21_1096 [Actinomycetota bacterium]